MLLSMALRLLKCVGIAVRCGLVSGSVWCESVTTDVQLSSVSSCVSSVSFMRLAVFVIIVACRDRLSELFTFLSSP